MNNPLEGVLCPKCTHPGGLKMFMEYVSRDRGYTVDGRLHLTVHRIPVLSCSRLRCRMILVGKIQGDMAVFPDPHVETGQS